MARFSAESFPRTRTITACWYWRTAASNDGSKLCAFIPKLVSASYGGLGRICKSRNLGSRSSGRKQYYKYQNDVIARNNRIILVGRLLPCLPKRSQKLSVFILNSRFLLGKSFLQGSLMLLTNSSEDQLDALRSKKSTKNIPYELFPYKEFFPPIPVPVHIDDWLHQYDEEHESYDVCTKKY